MWHVSYSIDNALRTSSMSPTLETLTRHVVAWTSDSNGPKKRYIFISFSCDRILNPRWQNIVPQVVRLVFLKTHKTTSPMIPSHNVCKQGQIPTWTGRRKPHREAEPSWKIPLGRFNRYFCSLFGSSAVRWCLDPVSDTFSTLFGHHSGIIWRGCLKRLWKVVNERLATPEYARFDTRFYFWVRRKYHLDAVRDTYGAIFLYISRTILVVPVSDRKKLPTKRLSIF